jgi:serine/threonine-protein kinase
VAEQRRTKEAHLSLDEALSVYRANDDLESPSFAIHLLVRSRAQEVEGRLQEAAELLDRSLVLLRRERGDEHPKTVQALAARARLVAETDPEVGESKLLEVIALQRRILPAGHPEIGDTLVELAKLQMALAMFDPAAETVHEALGLRRAIFPESHWMVAEVEALQAATECTLPTARQAAGSDPATAYRKGLATVEAKLGSDHPTCRDLEVLGQACR